MKGAYQMRLYSRWKTDLAGNLLCDNHIGVAKFKRYGEQI